MQGVFALQSAKPYRSEDFFPILCRTVGLRIAGCYSGPQPKQNPPRLIFLRLDWWTLIVEPACWVFAKEATTNWIWAILLQLMWPKHLLYWTGGNQVWRNARSSSTFQKMETIPAFGIASALLEVQFAVQGSWCCCFFFFFFPGGTYEQCVARLGNYILIKLDHTCMILHALFASRIWVFKKCPPWCKWWGMLRSHCWAPGHKLDSRVLTNGWFQRKRPWSSLDSESFDLWV